MNYNKLNNLLGWLTFSTAFFVYYLTIEPTVSFWDCGEYISTAYKLEVGHPPGAPFFQLMGRFFSLFASDVSNVAYMINIMSALSSAFTILFLFWTITALSKKLVLPEGVTPENLLGWQSDLNELFKSCNLAHISTMTPEQAVKKGFIDRVDEHPNHRDYLKRA